MTSELSDFAARLREFISISVAADPAKRERLISPNPKSEIRNPKLLAEIFHTAHETPTDCSRRREKADHLRRPFHPPPHVGCYDETFAALALELFALQFARNDAYRKICEARGASPETVKHWTWIPAVPTTAFKELDLTCLPPDKHTTVFHSSGTTEQRPSRHFHCAESLAVYEASLWSWFCLNVVPDLRFTIYDLRVAILTPAPALAPHSSLVHMFDVVRRQLGAPDSSFIGELATDGGWTVNFQAAIATLRRACERQSPLVLLGTAFSFVHLLDFLAEQNLHLQLPAGSRVMETGGYKGRSRSLPKAELHALITQQLGVPPSHIVCEYGMSELSSQAYDHGMERRPPARRDGVGVQALACSDGTLKRELQRAGSETGAPSATRHFHFPPWARAQIISPETGREVADGETGLIRVFDLANVFSVMAVQTEDLAVRSADGFELIGRAANVEPRGCSLMTV